MKHGKRFTHGIYTVVKKIFQEMTYLGESGSEVSHFIPKPRNFFEVKKLSENIKKILGKSNSQRDKEYHQ